MKSPQCLFSLLPCGLSAPKGLQGCRIAFFFPVLAFQRLFPYFPVIPALIVDLMQGEMAPVDLKLPRQSFLYIVQPLRGPVDVGSNVVIVNVKSNHDTLPFPKSKQPTTHWDRSQNRDRLHVTHKAPSLFGPATRRPCRSHYITGRGRVQRCF